MTEEQALEDANNLAEQMAQTMHGQPTRIATHAAALVYGSACKAKPYDREQAHKLLDWAIDTQDSNELP